MNILNGRGPLWQLAWKFFHAQPWQVQTLGLGWGSWKTKGTALQFAAGVPSELFFNLHNDWGQILFEFGWAGLALAVCLYLKVLLEASTRNQAILVGFGAAMVGNPVLHFVPTLLVVSTVFIEEVYAAIQRIPKPRPPGADDRVYGGGQKWKAF